MKQAATPVPASPRADGLDAPAGNKATARVFIALSAFLNGAPSLGVSEIAYSLGMTKSMVSRALSTLVNHNYVVRDESGTRYQLGYAIADFGALSTPPVDLHALCRPSMSRLRDITGATISLHIRVGHTAVCIDGLLGTGLVAREVPLGYSLPLHISAAARSLLAFLPPDHIAAYLDDLAQADDADQDRLVRGLAEQLDEIREQGYALGLGDYSPRAIVSGVSFPVRDANGRPHASLTVAAPAAALPQARIFELLPELRAVMRDLERVSALYLAEPGPV